MMKAIISDLMKRIPGKASEEWPMGEPFVQAFAHGSMSVEVYAPKAPIYKRRTIRMSCISSIPAGVSLSLAKAAIHLSRAWYFCGGSRRASL